MLPFKTPMRVNPSSDGKSPLCRSGWGSGMASILSFPPNPNTDSPATVPTPSVAEQATEPRDKIYAQRFRTKLCRNFEEKGSCPYESRCMFAHGEGQLRTTEMNLRDGIVSTQAIADFKTKLESDESAGSRIPISGGKRPPHSQTLGSKPLGVTDSSRNSASALDGTPERRVLQSRQPHTPDISHIVVDANDSPARSLSSEQQPSRNSDSSDFPDGSLPPANWSPSAALRRLEDNESFLSLDEPSNHSVLTVAAAISLASPSLSASSTSTDIGLSKRSFRWNPYSWAPILPQDTDHDVT